MKLHYEGRFLAFAFLAFWPFCARAETFDARVEIARQAENDPAFNLYEETMFDKVGRDLATLVSQCWGEDEAAQPRKFILVGDISPSGQAVAVEVQPDTDRPRCFAKGVSAVIFPAPPPFGGRAAFPFFLDVTVTH